MAIADCAPRKCATCIMRGGIAMGNPSMQIPASASLSLRACTVSFPGCSSPESRSSNSDYGQGALANKVVY
ncbi:hypothetical protein PLICRDRAFT_46375 [Plicaturopsis crispa FD-325 SS-3]|uniref:Uncharacterized protein n=1 Tax=Plicaturopsis crispa FD-325 SS-3 TaxID=944288 RepID=A0A0C9SWZ0_PLICR|nr:hypothetical protein PLICRDRAFT_46375 [Plicaturopsis crispa FD-325 SS-3]